MTRLNRRHSLAFMASPWITATAFAAEQPEPWRPTRAIRILVGAPAGTPGDTGARALAEGLSAHVRQPVAVENIPAQGGAFGMDVLAKAAADGYTLGFAEVSPLAFNPRLGTAAFDPLKDLTPVGGVMYLPQVLLATPASRSPAFRDLMGAAKARPNAARWATAGVGSSGHVVLEQLQHAAKVKMTHVPYEDPAKLMADALRGAFHVATMNLTPEVMQQVKARRLRPLAISAAQRLPSLQGVPTFAELGYPKANLSARYGVFAPGGASADLVRRINEAVNRVIAGPELAKHLRGGEILSGGSAAEFASYIAAESDSNYPIRAAAARGQ